MARHELHAGPPTSVEAPPDMDWTDQMLGRLIELQPGVDVGAYAVTTRISRIGQRIARSQEEVFARFGLNRGDVGVLSALRLAGPPNQLSPTRLFKGLMLSSAGITSRLDRLEGRGLVRRSRDPHDRRGVLVELTPEGRDIMERAIQANTAEEPALVATLTGSERSELAGLLKKVLAGLESPSGAEL